MLALVVAMLSAPAFAAGGTHWSDKADQSMLLIGSSRASQSNPCGNSYIALNNKCPQPPGCAC